MNQRLWKWLGLPSMAFGLVFGAHAEIVARMVVIHMDETGPTQTKMKGIVHTARIIYDDSMVDPVSHRVKILLQQHTDRFLPAHPDEVLMPMGNAWLDLGSKPYRYHYAASPGLECGPSGKPMGDAYTVVFDDKTERMTIRNQATGELILSGPYVVSDEVTRGPAIEDAVTKAPPVSPYPPRCP